RNVARTVAAKPKTRSRHESMVDPSRGYSDAQLVDLIRSRYDQAKRHRRPRPVLEDSHDEQHKDDDHHTNPVSSIPDGRLCRLSGISGGREAWQPARSGCASCPSSKAMMVGSSPARNRAPQSEGS